MKVIMIVLLLTENEAKSLVKRNLGKEYEQYENGDKEFVEKYFKDEYERLREDDTEDEREVFNEYYGESRLSDFFDLFDIPKSDGNGTFKINTILPEEVMGMEFTSFTRSNAEKTPDISNDEVYVVMADRQFTCQRAVTEGVYKNLAELCDEMKGKLDKYMPKNFKWYAHLGVLSGEPSF